jgi:hypothetical protein
MTQAKFFETDFHPRKQTTQIIVHIECVRPSDANDDLPPI